MSSDDDWDSWGTTPSSSSSYNSYSHAAASGSGGGGGWDSDTMLDPYAASKALEREKEKERDNDDERDEALRAMCDLRIGPPSRFNKPLSPVNNVGSSGYNGGRPVPEGRDEHGQQYHPPPPPSSVLPARRGSYAQSRFDSPYERHRERSTLSEDRNTPRIYDIQQTANNARWDAAPTRSLPDTYNDKHQTSMRTGEDANKYGRAESVSSRISSVSRSGQSYTRYDDTTPLSARPNGSFEKDEISNEHRRASTSTSGGGVSASDSGFGGSPSYSPNHAISRHPGSEESLIDFQSTSAHAQALASPRAVDGWGEWDKEVSKLEQASETSRNGDGNGAGGWSGWETPGMPPESENESSIKDWRSQTSHACGPGGDGTETEEFVYSGKDKDEDVRQQDCPSQGVVNGWITSPSSSSTAKELDAHRDLMHQPAGASTGSGWIDALSLAAPSRTSSDQGGDKALQNASVRTGSGWESNEHDDARRTSTVPSASRHRTGSDATAVPSTSRGSDRPSSFSAQSTQGAYSGWTDLGPDQPATRDGSHRLGDGGEEAGNPSSRGSDNGNNGWEAPSTYPSGGGRDAGHESGAGYAHGYGPGETTRHGSSSNGNNRPSSDHYGSSSRFGRENGSSNGHGQENGCSNGYGGSTYGSSGNGNGYGTGYSSSGNNDYGSSERGGGGGGYGYGSGGGGMGGLQGGYPSGGGFNNTPATTCNAIPLRINRWGKAASSSMVGGGGGGGGPDRGGGAYASRPGQGEDGGRYRPMAHEERRGSGW